jgi:Ssp1 endopeptidase immunity protein Rap1a
MTSGRGLVPIFLAFSLFSFGANAQGLKGIDLYKACSGLFGRSDNEAICLAFIRGFSEGIWVGLHFGEEAAKERSSICLLNYPLPDPVQAQLIIKKFLAENPQRLEEQASVLVIEALKRAFPCEKKTR